MSLAIETHLLFTGPAAAVARLKARAAATAVGPIAFHVNRLIGAVAHDGQWMGEIETISETALLVKVGTDNYALGDRLLDLASLHPDLAIHAAAYYEGGDAETHEFASGRLSHASGLDYEASEAGLERHAQAVDAARAAGRKS